MPFCSYSLREAFDYIPRNINNYKKPYEITAK